MRTRIVGAAACTFGLAAVAFAACGQDGSDRYAADAELLIAAFSDIHPGYARYTSEAEVDSAADELRRSVERGLDEAGFYLAVQAYLASYRCEHTEAELPEALRGRLASSMLPVDFEYVPSSGGLPQAIVVGVAEGVEGINIGDELLAVNGRTMGEAFGSLERYISVDGLTDHTKATIFAGTDDIGLTTFDTLFPLLFGESREFDLLLATPGLEPSKGVRVVTARGIDEQESLAMRGVPEWQNFSDKGAVRWELLDEDTAQLWVNTFVNYRMPVDPDGVFGPVFEAISASGADRLVLDFRGVGGGSGDVQGSLLRHLITEPITVGGPARVRTYEFDAYREHLRTWADGAFDMPAQLFTREGDFYIVDPSVAGGESILDPAEHAWQGELVILIGPNNESGATMMLAELREQREVTLIGEPTGGSAEGPTAGVIAFLTLPESGIVARLPLVWSRTSAQEFEPGMGVSPDVLAPVTAESLRAGRDPAMEAAGM